jgi:hypothetical protein
MIDFHRRAYDCLTREAETTPMSCLFSNACAHFLRNVGRAHGWAIGLGITIPRFLNNATACARTSMDRSYARTSSPLRADSVSLNPSRCCLKWSDSNSFANSVGNRLDAAFSRAVLSSNSRAETNCSDSALSGTVAESNSTASASTLRRASSARFLMRT